VRSNLTLRMAHRRFTLLTNAFPRSCRTAATWSRFHAAWYNFVKMHRTFKVRPALAAGVTDRLWSIDDLLALIGEWDGKRRQKPGRKPKAAK